MQRVSMRAAAALLCSAALLAACGGGGATSPNPTPVKTQSPTPAPSPTSLPTPAAQSNTASVAPSNSAPTTTTLPATGGIVPTVTVPELSSGSGTVAVTVATGADATMSRRVQAAGTMPGGPYLLQMDFVPTADMTFGAAPSFSLDVTQYVTQAGFTISEAAAYLEFVQSYAGIEDGSGNFNVVGPLTVNATSTALTVSYTGPSMTLTLKASQHYVVGIHVGPIAVPTATPTTAPTATPTTAPTATPTSAPTATPTSAPTATPTSAPTATPTSAPSSSPMAVNPTSVDVAGTGSSNALTFTVSGGSGSYAASGYDTSIVTVSQDKSDASKFTVTGVAAGSTSITITDSNKQTVNLPVTVTTLSGVIQ